MSVKRLTNAALLTGIALIIHIVEQQIPPLVPIPGVKMGLANIISTDGPHCPASVALLTKDARGKPSLRYVYDLADTRPVRGAKMPYLWEVTDEKHDAVAMALERQYGPTEENDIGWALMEQVKRAVNEVYRDHLEDLRYDTKDSFLEELDGYYSQPGVE